MKQIDTDLYVWGLTITITIAVLIYAKIKYFKNSHILPYSLYERIEGLTYGLILYFNLAVGLLRLSLGHLSKRLLPRRPLHNPRLRLFLVNHYHVIIQLSVGCIWLCIFLMGIGRYRSVFLNFVISAAIFIVADVLIIRGYLFRAVQILSDTAIFRTCPQCKFDNNALVTGCRNCSYRQGNGRIAVNADNGSTIIDNDIRSEIESYRKAGAFLLPTEKLMSLLVLDHDEVVLINMAPYPFIGYYKNGKRAFLSNLVLTTNRIVSIRSSVDSDGWQLRETIYYFQLREVSATMKKHRFMKSEPTLSLNVGENVYELTFSSAIPYASRLASILKCIKKRRPDISIETTSLEPYLPVSEGYEYMLKEFDRDIFGRDPKDI